MNNTNNSLSINTNISSLMVQLLLKSNTLDLDKAIQQLTTGYKINSAKDGAADYSIIQKMLVKSNTYSILQDNLHQAMSMLSTGMGSMNNIMSGLTRLRSLAVEVRNGTYSANEISGINSEVSALIEGMETTRVGTKYNGINIFESTTPLTGGIGETRRVGVANTSTSSIQANMTNKATGATKLNKITSLTGSQDIVIKEFDGTVVDTITLTGDSNLNDIISFCSRNVMHAVVNDGVLTISASNGRYIEDAISNGVLHSMGIDAVAGGSVEVTTGRTNTSSAVITYGGGTTDVTTGNAVTSSDSVTYGGGTTDVTTGNTVTSSDSVTYGGGTTDVTTGNEVTSSDSVTYGGGTTDVTTGNEVTSSDSVTYGSSETRNALGTDSLGDVITFSGNKTVNIKDADGTVVASQSFSSSSSINDLLDFCKTANRMSASIDDGIISMSSSTGFYAEDATSGGILSLLGIDVVEGSVDTSTRGRTVISSHELKELSTTATETTIAKSVQSSDKVYKYTTTTANTANITKSLEQVQASGDYINANPSILHVYNQTLAVGEGYIWVTTAQQLADAIAADSSLKPAKICLGGDIDLESISSSWVCKSNFHGELNGNGYKLSNLKLNRSSSNGLGLFSSTDSGSIIKNLICENFEITNTYSSYSSRAAALVGGTHNGTIDTVYVVGGSIESAYSDYYSSGIVDSNYGVINNVYNSSEAGNGITYTNYGTITNAYNYGDVKYGICDYNYGTMENVYNAGRVYSSGIASINYETASIINAYSRTGSYLVGENHSAIVNCYGGSVSLVRSQKSTLAEHQTYAALLLSWTGTKSYYVINYATSYTTLSMMEITSNQTITTNNGTITLTPSSTLSNMITQLSNKGLSMNVDADGKVTIASVDGGYITSISSDLANALNLPTSASAYSQTSTRSTPLNQLKTNADTRTIAGYTRLDEATALSQGYTWVTTAQQLADAIAADSLSHKAKICLGGDIDLESISSSWVCKSNFCGELNGNGYKLSNLKLTRNVDGVLGLLDSTRSGSTIKNLICENFEINNTASGTMWNMTAAAVVGGYNYGTIENVYVISGAISCNNGYVGGIVGGFNYGTMNNVYNSASVCSNSYASSGGIVHNNSNGTITNAYNSGNISCHYNVGGIAYNNSGIIINVYNSGNVSSDGGNVASILGYNSGLALNAYNSGTATANGTAKGALCINMGTVQNVIDTTGNTTFSSNCTAASYDLNTALSRYTFGDGTAITETDADGDTTMEQLGLTSDATITTTNGTINIAKTTTINGLIGLLSGKGIIASLSDGLFTINGHPTNYITDMSTNLQSVLGMQEGFSEAIISRYPNTNTLSDQLSVAGAATIMTSETTLSELGLNGFYNIVTNNGSISLMGTNTIGDSTTGLIKRLQDKGFTASVNDGKLTISGNDSVWITSITPELETALKLSGPYSTTSTQVVPATTMNSNTSLSDLGITGAHTIQTNNENITVNGSTMIGDSTTGLIKQLQDLGITASLNSGKLTITGNNTVWITSMPSVLETALNLSGPYSTTTPQVIPSSTMDSNTTLSNLGLTGSYTINTNNGNITVNGSTKIGDSTTGLIKQLQDKGFTAGVSGGKLTISGNNTVWITSMPSVLETALNLSGPYSTTTPQVIPSSTMDSNTTLSNLGLTGSYTINTNNGNITVNGSTKIGDSTTGLIKQLQDKGFTAGVSGGKLTISGNNTVWITSMPSVLETALNLSGPYSSTTSVTGKINTASNLLSYNSLENINTNTKLSDLGIAATQTITVNKNGSVGVISLHADDTLGTMISQLAGSTSSISSSVSDGKYHINASNSSYIVSMSAPLKNALKLSDVFSEEKTFSTDILADASNGREIIFKIGSGTDPDSYISFDSAFDLTGLSNILLYGIESDDALDIIDSVIANITQKDMEYGIVMLRLDSVVDALQTEYVNTVSAISTLRDADIAVASAMYIKSKILQEASASLLATANQSPSIALQLI